ncbi:hypothetical protein IJ00_03460 [Calothrix sp. 336/3]|uniref:hypothetical protein n=2 Tax=Calothrix sp. 336/3 TaxID=1337936 RepID=UPI0004E46C79|nr:hypothetical protein [Calothrix sp. 336/3]AKG20494.1 hypothetical protein IJ00_03460 [Calothrix sp. 336/3]
MDAEEMLRQQIAEQGEMISTNLLTELGNRAVAMGLIAGHGFHGGRYEILRQGEVMLLSPQEAQSYLQDLIAESEK